MLRILTAGSLLASACTVTTGEPTGFITANWDFGTVAGARLPCPTGFPTVEVTAVGPTTKTVTYDCSALSSGPIEVPISVYQVSMKVLDPVGVAYASSRTFSVYLGEDLANERREVSELFIDDGGRVELSMSLSQGPLGDQPVLCDQVDVAKVRLTFTGAAPTFEELIDCDAMLKPAVTVTKPVPAATYTLGVTLLDQRGAVRANGGQTSTAVFAPNGYVYLTGLGFRL